MNSPANHPSICFLGDFACPHGLAQKISRWPVPDSEFKVVNFEGAFPEDKDTEQKNGIQLYNSRESLDLLKRWNVKLASLANNHLLDANQVPSVTREILDHQEIGSCGGGDTLEQAAEPFRAAYGDHEFVFVAFGWRTIGCAVANKSQPGTNPLVHNNVIRSIEDQRKRFPDSKIVALMHWNYELEVYPLPAQRKLAFDAIRAGAEPRPTKTVRIVLVRPGGLRRAGLCAGRMAMTILLKH